MRKVAALALTAFVALLGVSTAPTLAANISNLKLSNQYVIRHAFCVSPAQLENVCVAWGQGQPGQLIGPCIKYQLQCVSPTIVH